MNEAPCYLRNHEAVVSAFGYWPQFHDAAVLAFERMDDRIALSLHGWEATPEIDKQGCHVLRKHHLVRFAFQGIVHADLTQFTAPNLLFELALSSCAEFYATGQFTVGLDSAMGIELCGSFSAVDGEVTAVLPCDRHAHPT